MNIDIERNKKFKLENEPLEFISSITNDPLPDEINERVQRNTLLNPISKIFLDKYPQSYDINTSYIEAMKSFENVVRDIITIDKIVQKSANNYIQFKLNMSRQRIFSPDHILTQKHSPFGSILTPNDAVSKRSNYVALCLFDINYELNHIFVDEGGVSHVKNIVENTIEDGYKVMCPIPILSEFCSLRHSSNRELLKIGEENEPFAGFFVIGGVMKYILPQFKKIINHSFIEKNDYGEQVSRAEIIYSRTFDYDQSYYIICALLNPKQMGGHKGMDNFANDYVVSPQFYHPAMVSEKLTKATKSKLLLGIPIKFIFGAFGALTDEEILRFICPLGNDLNLLTSIQQSILYGIRHRKALKNAGIELYPTSGIIILKDNLTEFTCKYIIGCLILSKEKLAEFAENKATYKQNVVQQITEIFNERFMPGIGYLHSDNSTYERNKAICTELGSLISNLYYIGNGMKCSMDKMSLTNRRFIHGQQLVKEFKSFHKKRCEDMENEIIPLIKDSYDTNILIQNINTRMNELSVQISEYQTNSLIQALKGTSKENSKVKTDMVVPKNYIFVQNEARQIIRVTNSTGSKLVWKERSVHPSELFYVCCTESPEGGHNVGRYKTPTIYTFLTTGNDGQKVAKYLIEHKLFKRNYIPSSEAFNYIIKINGNVFGYVEEFKVDELYNDLMKTRNEGIIFEMDISIYQDNFEGILDICTDTGRMMSVFVKANNCFIYTDIQPFKTSEFKDETDETINPDKQIESTFLNFTCKAEVKPEFVVWLKNVMVNNAVFEDGINQGFIEYIDPIMAENNCVIAPSLEEFYENPIDYTHIALTSHIHGIIAATITSVNMSVGQRATLTTNHLKSGIGTSIEHPQLKYLVEDNFLLAPQVPMTRPVTYDYLHINSHPIGQNVIVAFLSSQFNQEDSVIVNQASVENGLLEIDSLTMFMDEKFNKDEFFELPPDGVNRVGNPESYTKLSPHTSLPDKIGTLFYENDVLIGKIRKGTDKTFDISVINENPDGSYPKSALMRPRRSVIKNRYHDASKTVKMVSFGQFRCFIEGDKLNTMHGQKGTIGKILPPSQMPYSSTGIKPDFLFSAETIFKRRTYGQIYEGVMSLISSLFGCPLEMSPYNSIRSPEEIDELLKKIGIDSRVYELLYDPNTGRPYMSKCFFVNHYWIRSHHLVENKLQVRNGGKRDMLTMQPTAGRKKGGGSSIDRMSNDSLTAQGNANIFRALHLDMGSKIRIGNCPICKSIQCYFNRELRCWCCPHCGRNKYIIVKEIPPAANIISSVFTGLHMKINYEEIN
jgi:DNA-directed RNA polymerase beta subunit